MHKHGGGLHDCCITDFLVGVAVSAVTGCLVIAWFLHYLRRGGLRAVRVLPHCFWHNSACSGFHPPASVMKLLSPTQHQKAERNHRVPAAVAGPGDPVESGVVPRPGSLVGYRVRLRALSTSSAIPGSYLADSSSRLFGAAAFLFPLLDLPARLELDPLGGTGGRRRQDLWLDSADARARARRSPSRRCASSAAPSGSAARSGLALARLRWWIRSTCGRAAGYR